MTFSYTENIEVFVSSRLVFGVFEATKSILTTSQLSITQKGSKWRFIATKRIVNIRILNTNAQGMYLLGNKNIVQSANKLQFSRNRNYDFKASLSTFK